MDWIAWLGIGLVGWVVVAVFVAIAFAHLVAVSIGAAVDPLELDTPRVG